MAGPSTKCAWKSVEACYWKWFTHYSRLVFLVSNSEQLNCLQLHLLIKCCDFFSELFDIFQSHAYEKLFTTRLNKQKNVTQTVAELPASDHPVVSKAHTVELIVMDVSRTFPSLCIFQEVIVPPLHIYYFCRSTLITTERIFVYIPHCSAVMWYFSVFLYLPSRETNYFLALCANGFIDKLIVHFTVVTQVVFQILMKPWNFSGTFSFLNTVYFMENIILLLRTRLSVDLVLKGGPFHDVLHSILGAYTCYRPDVGYVSHYTFLFI